MDTEEKIISESIISEYRQALADAQLGLAMANGQLKAKDAIIAALREAEVPKAQKPGPPKVR